LIAGRFYANDVIGNLAIYVGDIGNPAIQMYYTGRFTARGPKSAKVQTASHGERLLYAMESPENWFEDFGSAQLVEGQAIVNLDPIFFETVNTDRKYHVFLTPNGNCTLYVPQKTPRYFKVLVNGGQADCEFDYRIVAKRKGYEDIRLE